MTLTAPNTRIIKMGIACSDSSDTSSMVANKSHSKESSHLSRRIFTVLEAQGRAGRMTAATVLRIRGLGPRV